MALTQRQSRFNLKRVIDPEPEPADLERLLVRLSYRGNAEHKRNPGDFGLAPPLGPRPGKTLCDDSGVLTKAEAERLLRQGVTVGLISKQRRGDGTRACPQNIWVVTADGRPLEAQLDNWEQATYHGYPMPANDDFRETVLTAWVQRRRPEGAGL